VAVGWQIFSHKHYQINKIELLMRAYMILSSDFNPDLEQVMPAAQGLGRSLIGTLKALFELDVASSTT
jgi:hypothetical protein